jgi:hypothetical protein
MLNPVELRLKLQHFPDTPPTSYPLSSNLDKLFEINTLHWKNAANRQFRQRHYDYDLINNYIIHKGSEVALQKSQR